jgi:hypothetical protein
MSNTYSDRLYDFICFPLSSVTSSGILLLQVWEFNYTTVLFFVYRYRETREPSLDIRKQVVAEIARLNKILALLDDSDDMPVPAVDGRTKAGRAGKPRRKGKMSAAARRKISRIQKARWAKWRAQR